MNSIIISSVVKLNNNPHYNNNSKHKHKPSNNKFLTCFNREVERINVGEEDVTEYKDTCYCGCKECIGCIYYDTEESYDKTSWYQICKKYRKDK